MNTNIAYLLFYEKSKNLVSENISNRIAIPLISSAIARVLTTSSNKIF